VESGTFAIVAHDASSRRLGVAVAAALPGVGAYCPDARAGVGAVSVQGQVHPALRRRLLDIVADGVPAEEALDRVWEGDAGRDRRQIVLVDREGRVAAATGEGVAGFCGHRLAAGAAAAGGHLASPEVLEAMDAAFADAPAQDLGERLVRALEAGERQGGDRRGAQSAVLLVVDRDGYPYVDLRVDGHPGAVAELRRLYDSHAERVLPGYAAWVRSLTGEEG
jgi:uncharacterized Ntn-hydrolase superfamily protein